MTNNKELSPIEQGMKLATVAPFVIKVLQDDLSDIEGRLRDLSEERQVLLDKRYALLDTLKTLR